MKFTQARVVLEKNGLLKKIPRSKYWRVEEEFIWYLDYNNKEEFVIIKKGFKTDFGSIPKLLQNIFNPTRYLGYILHDYLYSEHGEIQTIDGYYYNYNRKEADKILLEAMTVEGASVIEKLLVYIGVRIGGYFCYKK